MLMRTRHLVVTVMTRCLNGSSHPWRQQASKGQAVCTVTEVLAPVKGYQKVRVCLLQKVSVQVS